MGISGAAGSGKTYSALKIAAGIGGRIAVIDTERSSASLYSDRFDFDVLDMEPPYSPEKYIAAIELAEKSGYNVIVIDSLSHAWAGIGGILDLHDAIQKSSKSGNGYTAWREVTPLQNKLVDTITGSKAHVIASMRSKMEYVIENNGQRNNVRKVGLSPIQRDDVQYEFTVYFELSQEHVAVASKDRTDLFDGKYFTPNEQTGRLLIDWLAKPKNIAQAIAPQPAGKTEGFEAENKPVTAPRPEIKNAVTIQDIAKCLLPDLKKLFNKYQFTTRQIVDLWNHHGGDQQAIVASLSATAERKVA
ncbi:MAG TPA: ATP-binding protein [Candidatus Wallbacteria bacterium]|nr:ATP-binding protein [Candidatus Wallbacteria bacterium]